MKRIKIYILVMTGLLMTVCTACSDFFEPENNTTLNGKEYIKENAELYSGFLGIITRMQVIGDKAIYLTDTRGELLEPTGNTTGDLYSLYNYDDDLTGNTYADPASYYDVIISCNDFMQRAKEYKEGHENTVDSDHYKGLISSALRVKAWIYLTLGKIYGQAVWFDSPMQNLDDLSKYPVKNLDEIVNACDDLLETGFDGIDGKQVMKWSEWLNPVESTSISDEHQRWDMMVPGYFILKAEIALWKNDGATASRLILDEINSQLQNQGSGTNGPKLTRGGTYINSFGQQYDAANPVLYATESVIVYNYQYNQQNSLLKHLDRNGSYLLRPSLAAVKRFKDTAFNPPEDPNKIETSDKRFNTFKTITADEEYSIQKYRGYTSKPGHQVANDDVHIMIYHTGDIHLMLIEALNLEGRYEPAFAVMNPGGVNTYLNSGDPADPAVADPVLWKGFTAQWTSSKKTYCDQGMRGVGGLGKRDIWLSEEDIKEEAVADENLTGLTPENQIKKHNDIEMLKESMLELACEGKTYPLMIRVAKRWNDYSIISRFVSEKYPDGQKEQIASKIMNGAYFVPWDLDSKAVSH